MKDCNYLVRKDIPLDKNGENVIKKGTLINVMHDCVYLEGMLLPTDYQEDFMRLIVSESKNGWKYISPDNKVVGKSII